MEKEIKKKKIEDHEIKIDQLDLIIRKGRKGHNLLSKVLV